MAFCQYIFGCSQHLSPSDGHDCCRTCLGRTHAEAAFEDSTCSQCESMAIIRLLDSQLDPHHMLWLQRLSMMLRWLLCLPGIGLEWIPPPYSECSQLEDWFLGSEHHSQQQSTPVLFFQEVHEELTKKPFIARTCFALTSPDIGQPGGTPVLHQLIVRLQCTCTL